MFKQVLKQKCDTYYNLINTYEQNISSRSSRMLLVGGMGDAILPPPAPPGSLPLSVPDARLPAEGFLQLVGIPWGCAHVLMVQHSD